MKISSTSVQREELLVLLDDGVLRLGQDAHQLGRRQMIERDGDRQATDELRDQAVLAADRRGSCIAAGSRSRRRRLFVAAAEAHRFCLPAMRLETISSRPSNAPPQMKRMLRVSIWMYSWCGCLRPLWGGTLATVPSMILSRACWTPSPETSRVMRRVVGLAGDLVDLVDVDDAGLGAGTSPADLDQAEQDVLDILADVAGFGQRGGVGDREGNIEQLGERLGQQRLAAAGRADEQDVALLELDVIIAVVIEPALIRL